MGTVALMMKTQIGLGVLSIPAVFDTLGLIPGVICLVAIGAITTWSDYIVGVFKLRHREVYGIDDVGALLFGRLGREFLGVAFCLCENDMRNHFFALSNLWQIGPLLPALVCSGFQSA